MDHPQRVGRIKDLARLPHQRYVACAQTTNAICPCMCGALFSSVGNHDCHRVRALFGSEKNTIDLYDKFISSSRMFVQDGIHFHFRSRSTNTCPTALSESKCCPRLRSVGDLNTTVAAPPSLFAINASLHGLQNSLTTLCPLIKKRVTFATGPSFLRV